MKMSVTRALAELKSLDKRIGIAAASGNYVAIAVGQGDHQKIHQTAVTPEQMKSVIQSSFDKVLQLIVNRTALKSAIVTSNANTKIKLNGADITVAEAIELKTSVAQKEVFLEAMKNQLTNCRALVGSLNAKMDAAIEASLAAIYSNERGKVEPAMYDAIALPQKRQKEASLFDPRDVAAQIAKIQEEVDAVKTDLDFLLSESNARTDIEVELK